MVFPILAPPPPPRPPPEDPPELAGEKRTHVAKAEKLLGEGKFEGALDHLTIARGIDKAHEVDAKIQLLTCRANYMGGKYGDTIKESVKLAASGAPRKIRLAARGLGASAMVMSSG